MTFQNRIRREFIEESAIAPALYEMAVEIIEDTGHWQPNEALNQKVSRFYETRKPHSYGEIAMLLQESGGYWQGKPEYPRIDRQGKTVKYEAVVGAGATAYLPPVDPQTRRKVATRYGVDVPLTGSFWGWVAEHPELDAVLTEGGKKTLAALSEGWIAVGLLGVNSGVLKNEKIGGQKIRRLHPELVPGLAALAPGRRFILAMDEDSKPATRRKVAAAKADLGYWLSDAGASIAVAGWDQSEGKGLDDLLVNAGPQRLDQVLGSAKPFAYWCAERSISFKMRRKPDLHIKDDEFVTHTSEMPKTGILALWGGKGTAKGKATAELIKGLKALSLTHLRSLARDQAEGWSGAYIPDSDRHGHTFLKGGKPCSLATAAIPSILKAQGMAADVLVLDETPALLEFLLSSKICNKDGKRPLLIEELQRRIIEADLVILASADLTEEVLLWVEQIRGERSYLVRSDRRPLCYPIYAIAGTKDQAIADFTLQAQALKGEELLVFHADSKVQAEAVAGHLLNLGINSLLITSSTSGGDIESRFLSSKGADIPALIGMETQVIITSPSVKEGFSIEQHTDKIKAVWGLFQGGSITPEGAAQTLDRVRALTPRYLWAAERGRAYSKFSHAQTTTKFLKDFQRSSDALCRITRHSLHTETEHHLKDLDYYSSSMQLLAHIEVERNRGMRAFRARLTALLEAEGKQVTPYIPQSDIAAARATRESLRQVRSKLDVERAIAIENQPLLELDQVEALRRKEGLTPDENLALELFNLSRFYKKKISRDDVLRDDRGRLRSQIRHLEAVLDPDAATDISAASINRSPTSPQDWNRIKLQEMIIAKSGAANLIHQIWSGEVVELADELVQPIAQFLKTHAKDVAIAFNFSNIKKVSDRQATFMLLDWVGMKRQCHRRRVDGKPTRVYRIDLENLEVLKSVIERRRQADPTPDITDINSPGGSSYDPDEISDVASMIQTANGDELTLAALKEVIPPDLWRAASRRPA